MIFTLLIFVRIMLFPFAVGVISCVSVMAVFVFGSCLSWVLLMVVYIFMVLFLVCVTYLTRS
nr:MAG TPA: hypothetical protein [Crassvirales sp.]